MAKNKGMCFYYDWLEPLSLVPQKDFKRFVLAMVAYHRDGTEPPEFKGTAGIIAGFVFPQIRRSRELAEQGARGAAAKWTGNGAGIGTGIGGGNGDAVTQDKTRQEYKQNVIPPPPCVREEMTELEERFAGFWSSYPRKAGRTAAREAFMKINPTDELTEEMLRAVALQSRSAQWQREGGRYVPSPAAWLEGRRWEDELPENGKAVSDEAKDADRWFETKLKDKWG